MNRVLARAISILLMLTMAGCGLGLIDDPCEQDEDCDEGLICDIHAGDEDGTCQEPHMH